MARYDKAGDAIPFAAFQSGWRLSRKLGPAGSAAQAEDGWAEAVFAHYAGIEDGVRRAAEQGREQDPSAARGFLAELRRTKAAASPPAGGEADAARLNEPGGALTEMLKGGDGGPAGRPEEAAERLIRLASAGELAPESYADIKSLITPQDIFQSAVKSGQNAVLLSLALSVAPELIKSFQYLIKTGELDVESVKRLGMEALSGSARGFITGSISAAVTSSCRLGLVGESLKNAAPETVGAIVAMTYQILLISANRSMGKIGAAEMSNEIIRVMITVGCSVAAGSIGAAVFSPLGYFIGSLAGSMAGSLLYQTMYTSLISLCVDTGFTLFGMVDQDYEIPEEACDMLGLDTIRLDEVQLDEIQLDEMELDAFELDAVKLDSLGLRWVKRGVIGVNRIGYVTESI